MSKKNLKEKIKDMVKPAKPEEKPAKPEKVMVDLGKQQIRINSKTYTGKVMVSPEMADTLLSLKKG